MPPTVQMGLLVLGGILILIALVGGRFKLFGAEVEANVSNIYLRCIAFALGKKNEIVQQRHNPSV